MHATASRVLMRGPSRFTHPVQKPPRISTSTLYFEQQETLLDICATDSMNLLVCMQLTSKATITQARPAGMETEFNVKWPFRVIQGHVFYGQWKTDEGLHIVI